MKTKDEDQSKDDWFQRLDHPLKVINMQYARLFQKKKELTKNQNLYLIIKMILLLMKTYY